MTRERLKRGAPPESVISIIGPGMRLVGECTTDGTIRIEGSVQGAVRAGKAVVVGKEGVIEGDVITQDAVVSGRISGTLIAESRLELQGTCHIEGEVKARRLQLEEGAVLNGTVHMGENSGDPTKEPRGAKYASGAEPTMAQRTASPAPSG